MLQKMTLITLILLSCSCIQGMEIYKNISGYLGRDNRVSASAVNTSNQNKLPLILTQLKNDRTSYFGQLPRDVQNICSNFCLRPEYEGFVKSMNKLSNLFSTLNDQTIAYLFLAHYLSLFFRVIESDNHLICTLENLDKLIAIHPLFFRMAVDKLGINRSSIDPYLQQRSFSMLARAAALGKDHFILRLLEYGADINKKSGSPQVTPLNHAIRSGHIETVQLLLDLGAGMDCDNEESSPLHYACCQENVLRCVLKNGIQQKKPGYDFLLALLEKDKIVLQNMIARDPSIINSPIDFRSPLTHCARNRDIESVQFLLDNGAQGLDEALYSVVCSGYTDIIGLLLTRGADLNSKVGVSGSTPLMAAALAGNAILVREFLARGAQINSANNDGKTALDFAFKGEAATDNNKEVIQLLLDAGAQTSQLSFSNLYKYPCFALAKQYHWYNPIKISALAGGVALASVLAIKFLAR